MEDFGGLLMPINDLGYAPLRNIRYWTKQAKECYFNGLNCSICDLAKDLKKKCHMKPCVIELVKKFGKPKKEQKKELKWNP